MDNSKAAIILNILNTIDKKLGQLIELNKEAMELNRKTCQINEIMYDIYMKEHGCNPSVK